LGASLHGISKGFALDPNQDMFKAVFVFYQHKIFHKYYLSFLNEGIGTKVGLFAVFFFFNSYLFFSGCFVELDEYELELFEEFLLFLFSQVGFPFYYYY